VNTEPDAAAERLRQATAYHEAGHAAVAVYYENVTQQSLKSVALTLDDDERLGFCERAFEDPEDLRMRIETGDEDLVKAEIMITFAGDLAEEKAGFPDTVFAGETSDRIEIADLVARLVCKDPDAKIAALCYQTRKLLNKPKLWAAVERLAAELLRFSVVDGDRAYELLDGLRK